MVRAAHLSLQSDGLCRGQTSTSAGNSFDSGSCYIEQCKRPSLFSAALLILLLLLSSVSALIPAPCAPDCNGYFAPWNSRNVSDFNLTNWDTSTVTNMVYMFHSSPQINQSIGNWNVSAVTSMAYMFFGSLFNQPIGNWNVRAVTSMEAMFYRAYNFNQPIGNWNVASVRTMFRMFSECSSFNQPLSGWNVSSVTAMNEMFYSAAQFNNQIGSWDVGAVNTMANMFNGARKFNQPIGNWNTAAVTSMASTFLAATDFNQPVGAWNVSSVNHMGFMFHSASSFNQSIGSWNVSIVTNMAGMFESASSFNQPISGWNVGAVQNMRSMFSQATNFNQPIGNWDVRNVKDIGELFYFARAFNQSLNTWNVRKVTKMDSTFYYADSFNQPVGDWDVSSVVDMTLMFAAAFAFDQPLIDWNTSSVTSMRSMFGSARLFNRPLSSWDVSNVISMRSMFQDARSFRQDLSMWCPAKVDDRVDFGNLSVIIPPPWSAYGSDCGRSTPPPAALPPSSITPPTLAAPIFESSPSNPPLGSPPSFQQPLSPPLSQPSILDSPGSPPQASQTDVDSVGSSGNVGLMVGVIVASCILVLGLLVVAIFFILRRRNRRLRTNRVSSVQLQHHRGAEQPAFNINSSELQFGASLGEGSYGTVYSGTYQSKTVAIKQLSSISSAAAGEFFREASLMLTLPRHPNLVHLYGICQQSNAFALVMELVPGGSLQSHINSGRPFSNDAIKKICLGIASGMAALASHNIVHRDLASRNILLTEAMEPKISDFGFSRVVGESGVGKTATDVGPIRWMAPEAIKDSSFSEKSDVWSFGCLMIEIFTGKPPFPQLSVFDVAVAVRDGTRSPEIPFSSPAWAQGLLDSCFQRNPDDRPTFRTIVEALSRDSPWI